MWADEQQSVSCREEVVRWTWTECRCCLPDVPRRERLTSGASIWGVTLTPAVTRLTLRTYMYARSYVQFKHIHIHSQFKPFNILSVLFCIAHILHYWTTTASLCVMHSGGDYLMHENLRGLNTFLCSSCMKTSLYLCYRNVSNYSKFLYFDENRNHCSSSTRMTSLICGTDSCCWNLPNIISMQWKTERESSLYCPELEAKISQRENLAKWNQNYLFGWKTLKVGLGRELSNLGSQLFFIVTHHGTYMQHQVEYKCIGIIKTHGVHLLWT